MKKMKRSGKPFTTFFHSIRFRLVLWFTAILAIVLFAFSSFIYLSQTRDIRGDALYRLDRKSVSIAAALSSSGTPTLTLQELDIFVLLSANGKVVASRGVVSDKDVVALVKNAQQASVQSGEGGSQSYISWIEERGDSHTHYMFIAKPIPNGVIILGNPFDPYNLFNRLTVTLLIGSLLTLAVAIGGGLWLADRAMRPVQTITQAAREISDTDLSRRLNLKSKNELGELADTFDGMVARLQSAFERQRQFVADASHELRTPLTIVNLEASRALASRRTGPEYERALNVIRSENEFMSHLVNDLLTLARMDSGQMAMDKNLLDLSDVALDAIERLEPLAERIHVTLEAGDLPETILSGDRQYLLQMLSNLIENGIKYTSGKDRRVKVETGQTDDEAWVRVSDNGVGIPEESLPHLFDRFYRVDKVRTRNDEEEQASGSGLGLSIVHWIAQAHGGKVNVESKVGEGTTFEVRFKTS